ncbi:MAG: DHH family phosphoesterase [Bacteroidia bacterium]
MFKAKDLEKLKKLLSETRSVVILSHKNPDGDAVGSALGLYHYLVQLKHKVTVILPDAFPEYLAWMPDSSKILIYEEHPKKCVTKINEAELIFCVDFNTLNRVGDLDEPVRLSNVPKVLIDHHPQPENFATWVNSDVKSSSTSQLIYETIVQLGDKKKINKKVANCLYTGIMTDTGSFRFPSTKSETHRIAAELIDAGADNCMVHDKVFDQNTESRMRLLGYCLSEKLKIFEEFGTAYITLSKDELQHFNYQKGDTEGVVNYALSIKGIKFAAIFKENEDHIRISFRSKGKFSVNDFARKHFNGGGHINAAGGNSDLSLDETISKFVSLLPEYRKELTSK